MMSRFRFDFRLRRALVRSAWPRAWALWCVLAVLFTSTLSNAPHAHEWRAFHVSAQLGGDAHHAAGNDARGDKLSSHVESGATAGATLAAFGVIAPLHGECSLCAWTSVAVAWLLVALALSWSALRVALRAVALSFSPFAVPLSLRSRAPPV